MIVLYWFSSKGRHEKQEILKHCCKQVFILTELQIASFILESVNICITLVQAPNAIHIFCAQLANAKLGSITITEM